MSISVFSENETPQSKMKRGIFGKLIPTYVCTFKWINKLPIEYVMFLNESFLSKSVFSNVVDLREHLEFLLSANF